MNCRAATAIVVTYNSADQITAALVALSEADVAVVVVDNASSDATAAIVRRDFADVEIIENESNVGFAKAVNQGLAVVRSETVLLINPDCTVPRDTTHGLVAYLAAHPEAGVAAPRLVGRDGRVAISAHPFESLTSVVLSRFGGSLLPVRLRRVFSGARRREAYDVCLSPGRSTSVDWVSGACLAVRTDLLHDVAGLDERYFMYYEDEELCWQAKRLGKEVVYLHELVAVHEGGTSSEVAATWHHLYRSMLVFFALHRRSSYQAVRVAVLVRAGVGLLTAGVRLGLRRGAGAARARAWRRVAGIAWSSRRPEVARMPERGGVSV